MRRRYLPGAWHPRSSGSIESNTGDGMVAGQRIGAALCNMDSAWWGPMLSLPDEPRSRLLTFERALPGSLIVNQAGRRYMNEAMAYDLAGRRMIEADVPGAGTTPSYFLFDERYRRRYPVGPLIPGIPIRLHQRGLRQVLVRANRWEALAERIGLPAAALAQTIADFNRNAVAGRDPAYGRGGSAYDRFYGDPEVRPNPNLAPLATPPYYAIPIQPGDIGTNGGLRTNEHAQVLDERRCADRRSLCDRQHHGKRDGSFLSGRRGDARAGNDLRLHRGPACLRGESRDMSTQLAANKQVIVDYFREQTVAGLGSALRYLADDATWWVPGQWELSGTYTKAQLAAAIDQLPYDGLPRLRHRRADRGGQSRRRRDPRSRQAQGWPPLRLLDPLSVHGR